MPAEVAFYLGLGWVVIAFVVAITFGKFARVGRNEDE